MLLSLLVWPFSSVLNSFVELFVDDVFDEHAMLISCGKPSSLNVSNELLFVEASELSSPIRVVSVLTVFSEQFVASWLCVDRGAMIAFESIFAKI